MYQPLPTIVLFGAHRWGHDYVVKDAVMAGLRTLVVIPRNEATLVDDWSRDETLAKSDRIIVDTSDSADDVRSKFGDCWKVLGMDDYCVSEAANMAMGGDSECFPVKSTETVRAKHLLRQVWNSVSRKSSHLVSVQYCLYKHSSFDSQEPIETIASRGFLAEGLDNFIVKPNALAGSIAIRKSTRTELSESVREVLQTLDSDWRRVGEEFDVPVEPQVLAEEQIERSRLCHASAEYSAEYVSFGGRHRFMGLTQKWVSADFIEAAHIHPPLRDQLGAQKTEAICGAIESMLSSLEVQYGISHWEFIVTKKNRIALVEGHLRPPGDRINELVGLATGTSLTESLFRLMLGQPLAPKEEHIGCAGIFWLKPVVPVWNVCSVECVEVPGCSLIIEEEECLHGYSQASPYSGPTRWDDRHLSIKVKASSPRSLTGRLRLFVSGIRINCVQHSIKKRISVHLVSSLHQ